MLMDLMIGNYCLNDKDTMSPPPGSSDKPAYFAVPIDGIVSVLVSVLESLDNGAGDVVLVVIGNPCSVIVVVSSPADDKDAATAIVVSDVSDGSGAIFMIVSIDEGASAVIISITVTVIYWSPILVIVLAVGAGAVIVTFIIVSVDIVKIEIIILDDGSSNVVVAVVINDEGAVAFNSTNNSFSRDKVRITTFVYWLMDGE